MLCSYDDTVPKGWGGTNYCSGPGTRVRSRKTIFSSYVPTTEDQIHYVEIKSSGFGV